MRTRELGWEESVETALAEIPPLKFLLRDAVPAVITCMNASAETGDKEMFDFWQSWLESYEAFGSPNPSAATPKGDE
jgi:hypothetical protein